MSLHTKKPVKLEYSRPIKKGKSNKNIGRIPIPNFNPYFSISFPETKVLNINSKNFINPKNKPRNEVISVLVLKNSL